MYFWLYVTKLLTVFNYKFSIVINENLDLEYWNNLDNVWKKYITLNLIPKLNNNT